MSLRDGIPAAGSHHQLSARVLWRNLLCPSSGISSSTSRVPHDHFPLLLLGYGDYLQLADAVAHAVCCARKAVLVFAPVFLLGKKLQLCSYFCVYLYCCSTGAYLRAPRDRAEAGIGSVVQGGQLCNIFQGAHAQQQ